MKSFNSKITRPANPSQKVLTALTTTALVLPGLLPVASQAADDDSVDFQYSHYQEGRRGATFTDSTNSITNAPVLNIKVPNNRQPIEVDSIHGSARMSLTDRIKFAFNYIEDTWSGATPYGSAPERSGALSDKYNYQSDAKGNPIISGASGYNATRAYFDIQGNSLYKRVDPMTGKETFHKDRPVHVMGYASPESRKQGDFKLTHEWDEAALSVGGGISTEHDYESRFVNLGGRMDFNQKQTTVNLSLSYTNSSIHAELDNFISSWVNKVAYLGIPAGHDTHRIINGTRQDWASRLDLTQVINKTAVLGLGMSYVRNTGFLENPYKVSYIFNQSSIDFRTGQNLPEGILSGGFGNTFVEQRPDERNMWSWNLNWAQYVAPLDAALHFNYQFAHDDWGINAHTFDADWVQPLVAGWTLTPRVRYYSQDAAFFYQPYFIVHTDQYLSNVSDARNLVPQFFSSDQRLSGFGALSGGLTLNKQVTKGVGLEAGFEYYTHQGKLKLGGGGEQDFADFDYWVANAGLKVSLDAIGRSFQSTGDIEHKEHHTHGNIPAGVLFAHTLGKAGEMMVGYRYQHSQQAGSFLHADQSFSQRQTEAQGCPDPRIQFSDGSILSNSCTFLPKEMTMSMHMLELMYAPADWLSLMFMPQFMDMEMPLYPAPGYLGSFDPTSHLPHPHTHRTGGIGDTGMYALVKLFGHPSHHLHTSLGFTAPTGDTGIKLLTENSKNLDGPYAHYMMQLGSGTWDFKPSLTYLGNSDAWNWGAQLNGTKRLGYRNSSGYKLGDMFEVSLWGGYDFTNWLSGTVRVAYTWQGAIKGRYYRNTRHDLDLPVCNRLDYIVPDDPDGDGVTNGPDIFDQASYNQCLIDREAQKQSYDRADRPTPMDYPSNYGGHYVDVGFGLSTTVPTGAFAGNRLAFEWLQPVYTNVNGYQLDRDGALSFTWSYGF